MDGSVTLAASFCRRPAQRWGLPSPVWRDPAMLVTAGLSQVMPRYLPPRLPCFANRRQW